MKREKFLELEYMTLRKEIENSKDRLFKIMVGGATIIPTAQYVVQLLKTEIDNIWAIKSLLPFLVIIMILLFLSENNSLMRCGWYIREHIEPQITPKIHGWENWLEQEMEPSIRLVDRFVITGFYLLSACYYVGTAVIAAHALCAQWNINIALCLVPYLVIALLIVRFLLKNVRVTTKGSKKG